MQKRNATVDVAKYIAALLVVGIHTSLFSDVNETLYFVVVHIICRTAVPFFAICTGYYIGCRLEGFAQRRQDVSFKDLLLPQWKRVIKLYMIWTCLYLLFSIPFWIETGWFSLMAFVDFSLAALTSGSHYHLWYLLYLIYAMPLMYLLVKWIPDKHQPWLIAVLWIWAVINYTYKTLLPEVVRSVAAPLGRFSLLPILPTLLLLGVYISGEKRKPIRAYLIGFSASFVLLSVEAFMLKKMGIVAVSYIVFTLPTMYFLFHIILEVRLPISPERAGFLGAISTFVYCVHPMFIETMGRKIESSVLTYLFVAVSATMAASLFVIIKRCLQGKKDRSCFN